MNENIKTLSSQINKGERIGPLVQSLGRQLRAIGFPTNKGKPDMTGTQLSFEGCYPGGSWFTINTPEGNKLVLPVKAVQEGPDLGDNPYAVVPIRDISPFYGLMLIRPVSNAVELHHRKITFFFETMPEERWPGSSPREAGINTSLSVNG